MSKKKLKRRGSSKAGRPKKEGERYASGNLKPPGPNAVVIARRRELVGASGDISKATNDLDVALARGWLEEEDHRAAAAYTALYRRAGVDLPRMRTANLGESEGEHAKEMSRAGVVQQGANIRPLRDLDGDPEAQETLKLIWRALKPEEKRALAHACLCEGSLDFVRVRLRGAAATTRFELELKQALTVVRTVLDPRVRRRQHGRNDMVDAA